jgi:hypothetical protein
VAGEQIDSKKRRCFLISPIGDPDSQVRKQADTVRDYVVKPALRARGYEVLRADDIARSNVLTNTIVQELIDADLAVAYLYGTNPNVYYEIAIRHAFHKEVILVADISEHVPFDISAMQYTRLDTTSPADVEATKQQLAAKVSHWENNQGDVHSLVSNAVATFDLFRTTDPMQQAIQQILAIVQEQSSRSQQQGSSLYSSSVVIEDAIRRIRQTIMDIREQAAFVTEIDHDELVLILSLINQSLLDISHLGSVMGMGASWSPTRSELSIPEILSERSRRRRASGNDRTS